MKGQKNFWKKGRAIPGVWDCRVRTCGEKHKFIFCFQTPIASGHFLENQKHDWPFELNVCNKDLTNLKSTLCSEIFQPCKLFLINGIWLSAPSFPLCVLRVRLCKTARQPRKHSLDMKLQLNPISWEPGYSKANVERQKRRWKMKNRDREAFPLWLSNNNSTSIQYDEGSIPGLAQ